MQLPHTVHSHSILISLQLRAVTVDLLLYLIGVTMSNNIGRASLSLTHLLVDEGQRLRALQQASPSPKCNCGYLMRGAGIVAISLVTIPVGIIETILRIAVGILGLLYLIIKGEVSNYAKRTAKVLTAGCCFAFDSKSPTKPPLPLPISPLDTNKPIVVSPSQPTPIGIDLPRPVVRPVAGSDTPVTTSSPAASAVVATTPSATNPREKYPEYDKAYVAYYEKLRPFLTSNKVTENSPHTSLTKDQWFKLFDELIPLSSVEQAEVSAYNYLPYLNFLDKPNVFESEEWTEFLKTKLSDFVHALHPNSIRLVTHSLASYVQQFNTVRIAYHQLMTEYNKLPVGHSLPKPISNLRLEKVMEELQFSYAAKCRQSCLQFLRPYRELETLIETSTPAGLNYQKLVNAVLKSPFPPNHPLNRGDYHNFYATHNNDQTIEADQVNIDVLREVAFKIFDQLITRAPSYLSDIMGHVAVGNEDSIKNELGFLLYFCFSKDENLVLNNSGMGTRTVVKPPSSLYSVENIEKLHQFAEKLNQVRTDYHQTKTLYDQYVKDYPGQEPPFDWDKYLPTKQ